MFLLAPTKKKKKDFLIYNKKKINETKWSINGNS